MAPELDLSVLKTMNELLAHYFTGDKLRHVTKESLSLVEIEEGSNVWFLELSHYLSHKVVPSSSWLLESMERAASDYEIATETLIPADLNILSDSPQIALPIHYEKFAWVESPIVNLSFAQMLGNPPFEWYLSTLTSKRRYKVKEALEETKELGYTDSVYKSAPLSHSHLTLSTHLDLVKELTPWVQENLAIRFGEEIDEWDCAFKQWLWFVAAYNSGYGWLQKIINRNNELIAITYHIMKGHNPDSVPIIYFQGIVQDETKELPNIGAQCLSLLIQKFTSIGVQYFDPTCRVSFNESSTDTYKRLVVNRNIVKPMLYVGSDLEDAEAPYFDAMDNYWTRSKEVKIHGRKL